MMESVTLTVIYLLCVGCFFWSEEPLKANLLLLC